MLKAGANNFSGTLMEENITQAAGEKGKIETGKISELIREAGRIPRERPTTYDLI